MNRITRSLLTICSLTIAGTCLGQSTIVAEPDQGAITQRKLTWDGDLASKMIDGVDRFLLRKLAQSKSERDRYWQDVTSADHQRAKESQEKLRHLLGLRDERTNVSMQLVTSFQETAEIAKFDGFRVLRVRWPVLDNRLGALHGEGILLEPDKPAVANVVAIPDCDQSPEEAFNQFAGKLGDSCRVLIPVLISRSIERRRNAELTNREYLYRSSFQLGRHVAGYELQKVFSVIDWFGVSAKRPALPIGVVGWGEGARLAMLAAALDTRIDAVCISGYFGPREGMWDEPIDRNAFGLLNLFGDAELSSLAAMHGARVVIDPSPGPTATVRTRGGAPYTLSNFTRKQVEQEFSRIAQPSRKHVRLAAGCEEHKISDSGLAQFASDLNTEVIDRDLVLEVPSEEDNASREKRQIAEIERYNQALLTESPFTRDEYFKRHDTSSLAAHNKTIEAYRTQFRDEVIGHFRDERLPANPRSRQVLETDRWTGHEVVLDVFPDVFAYGILLMPKDIRPEERRPVVVCQHGLEGRPRNVIEGDHPAYHDYAAKLADEGFITFAPQNIYIFEDRFRTLQRKANPIGKTLFSIMVPQHQQTVDWLASLPQVDPDRIAFYGLSYGGKSAMRIPPLVDRYCLSICSADFNDWVWKNASTRSPYSYVWTGEYEIFEWDLGSTFNYAEMAALIAPRPFMVERGHFDGVAPDDRVAKEFAKVRHLYQAKLGIGDRCEIEFFVGPHTINGKGTFEFLRRHLDWPKVAN